MKKKNFKIVRKIIKNGFIERFKNVTFKFQLCYDLHIYIIHKILLLIKNSLNYLKYSIIFECFLRSIIKF